MQHSPALVLFPGYRRRILGLLLLRPDELLHGREIARRTGLASGTIARELQLLASAGLLRREERGNQVLYGANRDSPIFAEMASILRKTSGLADVLAEALSTAKGEVAVAFVYGSLARGAEVATSDVDLMVIGNVAFGEVAACLHPAQATLGREINAKVFRPEEWRAHVAGGEPFVRGVLARPKIFVMGTSDELAQLGGNESRHDRAVAKRGRAHARQRPPPAGRRKG